MMAQTNSGALLLLVSALTSAVACEKEAPKPSASPSATVPAPKLTAAPKPPGPPELRIEDIGPKVGYDLVLIDKPDGKDRLRKAVDAVASEWAGRDLEVKIARQAKTPWVAQVFAEVERVGVKSLTVLTDTRPDFPKSLQFAPVGLAKSVPDCSLVLMVLADRATAVWKLSGGTASRRSKGLGGPDLSTTAETIERRAKACKQSDTYFVSAADEVEWGLTYDLAASAKTIPGVRFARAVLLTETPVAGRVVKLD
jgi:hypothetical protein